MSKDGSSAAGASGPALIWSAVPVLLLASAGLGWTVLVRIALDDPGFSLEPAYYEKARTFDRTVALEEAGRALGFSIATTIEAAASDEIVVVVRDQDARFVQGERVEVELFPNARAGQRQTLVLTERGASYRAAVRLDFPGLWEARVRVLRSNAVVRETVRFEVGEVVGLAGRSP